MSKDKIYNRKRKGADLDNTIYEVGLRTAGLITEETNDGLISSAVSGPDSPEGESEDYEEDSDNEVSGLNSQVGTSLVSTNADTSTASAYITGMQDLKREVEELKRRLAAADATSGAGAITMPTQSYSTTVATTNVSKMASLTTLKDNSLVQRWLAELGKWGTC